MGSSSAPARQNYKGFPEQLEHGQFSLNNTGRKQWDVLEVWDLLGLNCSKSSSHTCFLDSTLPVLQLSAQREALQDSPWKLICQSLWACSKKIPETGAISPDLICLTKDILQIPSGHCCVDHFYSDSWNGESSLCFLHKYLALYTVRGGNPQACSLVLLFVSPATCVWQIDVLFFSSFKAFQACNRCTPYHCLALAFGPVAFRCCVKNPEIFNKHVFSFYSQCKYLRRIKPTAGVWQIPQAVVGWAEPGAVPRGAAPGQRLAELGVSTVPWSPISARALLHKWCLSSAMEIL